MTELEARTEQISALASLPQALLEQLHTRMLIHTLEARANLPEALSTSMALFVSSGSLDLVMHAEEQCDKQRIHMSLVRGDSCCASDLQVSNLSAKAGEHGVVLLTVPETQWSAALHERQLDDHHRMRRLGAAILPLLSITDNRPPTNLRLNLFKGGSVIVRQGDPVTHLMWVERGSCVAVICFRGDKHVAEDTLPGHSTQPLVRAVASLNAQDALGALVHVVPEAMTLVRDSRTLRTSITPIVSASGTAMQTLQILPGSQSELKRKECWQWSVCVPEDGEAYILSAPLSLFRYAPPAAAASFRARAKLEATWWIKQLKRASVSDFFGNQGVGTSLQPSHGTNFCTNSEKLLSIVSFT
jgi:hypothetical protein